uniref:Transporter associated with antigen processing, subunit type a n=1 Tax=Cyprinodon variegatus TaxID=28743 RepID=A0A3Q2DUA2_CYPVA
MAGKTEKKVYQVIALIVAVSVDLSLFYASGFAVFHRLLGGFAHLWLSAALRWSAVTVVSLLFLGHLKPLLIRFLTAYSLLPAVFETGTRVLYREQSQCGPGADVRCWMMFAGASLGAALFWEITIPDSQEEAGSKQQKQRSRVLFMRVVRLYRPDYALLLGGLVFLSLATDVFMPLFLFFVTSMSAGCRGGLLICAISSFARRIKVKLFEALTKQEIAFFETVRTGEITSRLSKDTNLTGRTVCLNVNVLLRTFLKTMGMISLMMSLSWKLTFLVLMETPITGLMQNIYDTHYQRLSQEMQDAMARTNDSANEVVFGIRVVRSFNTEKHEADRYDERLKETQSLKTRRDIVRYIYLLARRLTGLGMQVLILYYGRLFIQMGQMTTGNLVSFIIYQSDLGTNIRTLTYIFGDMLNSVMAAGKVFEYIDRKPQISMDGKRKPEQLEGRISYCGLNFAYPSNPEKTVLQDFSLELKPGQVTALVGPSGEGKSTCVSLLQRLYEPQEGEILLDGEPLKSYDHHFFHRKIAVVSQEPVLFSGSIRDNITYGLTNCSQERIEEAARKANAHDFIKTLEKGYDTEVGESGGQLSKSERQRIGIARALVREPKIVILDEITSSLDAESENKVLQGLASCPNQTLLVIAHRLKTIEKADQIVVVRRGQVEEKGTHQELMEMQGSYHKLRNELFDEVNSPK